MSMSNFSGIGNLTHSPELKTAQNGKVYLPFTIAINHGNEDTDFIKCVAWEKTANLIADYVKKGHKLGVSGKLRVNKYNDKEGIARETPQIKVYEITFLPNKQSEPKEDTEGLKTNGQSANEFPF